MFRIITFSVVLLLSGCAQQQPNSIITASPYSVASTKNSQQQALDTAITAVNTNDKSIVPAKSYNFHGLVTLNAQQRTIKLCNNDTTFNLQTNKQLLEQMQQRQGLAYIEFEGQLNQSQQGDYQRAIVKVEQLHFLSSQTSNSCQQPTQPYNFALIGSEPSWQGLANNNKFSFKIADIDSEWAIKKSIITKGISALVETENNTGEQLNIAFTGHGCTDDNQDFWQYQTKIQLKNKQISGCGKYPNQQYDEARWLGHYSYSNSNVSIELTLTEHHNAILNYRYSNGLSITETGYWHLFGASGLKLVLTARAAEKINTVFHFRRDGIRLLASQQWRNNHKYSFNGASLILDRMTSEVDVTTRVAAPAQRQLPPLKQASPSHTTPAINHAIVNYFQMHKTAIGERKYRYAEYDLNGDGQDDLLVLLDWCQAQRCLLLVFENTSRGYKFISRTTGVSTPIQISRHAQHSWQSLLLKQDQQWQQLDFNGISYPASSRQSSQAKSHDVTGVELMSNTLGANWGIAISK